MPFRVRPTEQGWWVGRLLLEGSAVEEDLIPYLLTGLFEARLTIPLPDMLGFCAQGFINFLFLASVNCHSLDAGTWPQQDLGPTAHTPGHVWHAPPLPRSCVLPGNERRYSSGQKKFVHCHQILLSLLHKPLRDPSIARAAIGSHCSH